MLAAVEGVEHVLHLDFELLQAVVVFDVGLDAKRLSHFIDEDVVEKDNYAKDFLLFGLDAIEICLVAHLLVDLKEDMLALVVLPKALLAQGQQKAEHEDESLCGCDKAVVGRLILDKFVLRAQFLRVSQRKVYDFVHVKDG